MEHKNPGVMMRIWFFTLTSQFSLDYWIPWVINLNSLWLRHNNNNKTNKKKILEICDLWI